MQKECTRLIATMLFCLLMTVSLPAVAADSQTDADSGDIVAMLTEKLKLTQDQADKLKPEIDTFVNTIDRLKADQEKEGADPEALVKGAKKAQKDFQKALKKIFTPQQYDQYNAIKEKAVRGMFNDLAEIQLMDLQPKVGFNDDQLTQLVPILGDALFEVVKIAWEHAGKRLRIGQKIRIAKHLKHIQKDSRKAVSKVLTPEQLKTWDKIKEQASHQ